MSYSILGVGSPCVDIIYRVNDDFLNDNNIKKGDGRSTSWEHFSSVLENCKKQGHEPLIATGGSTANTLKGLSRLGNKVALYGAIGNDHLARYFEDTISDVGIASLLKTTSVPTSQIAVFVTPDHQRSFLSYAGANRLIVNEPLHDAVFKGVNLMHVEGYMIDELGIQYVEMLMKHAKKHRVAISIDMGCPRIAKTYSSEILRLISSYITITFANQDEVAALLNLTAKEGCELLSKMCPVAVIGIGKDGCWVGGNGKLFHADAIKVEAVDTTGAGDLFACGFLHGFLKGFPLKRCAAIGNLLGGTVVTHLGAEIPEAEWPALKETILHPSLS